MILERAAIFRMNTDGALDALAGNTGTAYTAE